MCKWELLLVKIPVGGDLLEGALKSHYICIIRTVNFGKVFV